MNPYEQFCPNMGCSARGKIGEGNITIHSLKKGQYKCRVCGKTFSETTGTAQLGHFDRSGAGNTSWNSAHPSRGCSQEGLVSTGGAGMFYCFAINAPKP